MSDSANIRLVRIVDVDEESVIVGFQVFDNDNEDFLYPMRFRDWCRLLRCPKTAKEAFMLFIKSAEENGILSEKAKDIIEYGIGEDILTYRYEDVDISLEEWYELLEST